jgi:L-ascorbate metabolism protein UlaG (beta-lactamase superfamily)
MPLLLCLALLAMASTEASSQASPQLSARFIGNMAVAITDGQATLISDFPYESGYSGYMTYAPSEIRSSTSRTIALVTHGHRDHFVPDLIAATDWKLVAPPDVLERVPADRRLDAKATGVAGLTIVPIPTPHARGGHYSYLVTWHGRRLYFTGDTEQPDALLEQKNLDLAFVSPWLYRAVLRRGAAIDARRIVIYHHEAGETVSECTGTCVVPKQGDAIAIGR